MPDLNDALRNLAEFIKTLDFDTERPNFFGTSEPFILLSKDENTLFIRGESFDNYNEVVRKVFDSVSAEETISRDSVERLVNDLVFALAKVKAENLATFEVQLNESIRGLRTALQSKPSEWEFYVPVIGFAPSELPFTVGMVDFYQADSAGTEEYWGRASELNPEYAGRKPEEFIFADFAAQFGNRSIGRVRISAVDLVAAQRLALKTVRLTLDCINFFADKDSGTALRIKGDVEQGQRMDAAIRLSDPVKATGRFTRIAPWRGLPIKQISKGPGFRRISELLVKKKPSRLEDRILRAVQWAGRARVEPRDEESFLLFAVALETLLIKDSGNPGDLLYQLKLRTAHLATAQNLASRKLTIKQIGELYKTRSKIVHTGKFNVTDSELYLIEEYARIALFIVLDTEPFSTLDEEDDFEAWFETRLLGLSAVSDKPDKPTSS